MKLIDLRKVFALSFALAFVAGCSTAPTDTTGVENGGYDAETSVGAETSGLSAEELERRRLEQEQRAREGEDAALREVRVFYFDFDSNIVKPEAHLPLQAHAAYLQANPNVRVVLNGYADERGTKEYNLALGERRAKAVERFLVVSGASASQIEVVSYGEEFPADPGHNEEAWAKNRRVELVYQ